MHLRRWSRKEPKEAALRRVRSRITMELEGGGRLGMRLEVTARGSVRR
jgi:hypothetical protein